MTALVAWLWQGTALALAALVVLRAARRLDAATRHALWWGVLATVLALPWLPRLSSLARAPEAVATPAATAAASLVLPAPPDWVLAIAVGAWLGTVVLGALRIARGLAFLERLRGSAQPLDRDRASRLSLWTSTPSARRVALLVSPQVRTACAVGLGRAAIVLPPSLLEAVDDETLDQIVMHERAHLDRYDDVWRLVEAVADAVAGLHPGVRVALAQIGIEREAACDDRVVLQTGAAARYAASLASAASSAASLAAHGRLHLLPGAVGRPSALVARVGRLLDETRRRRARLTPAATLAGLVLLGSIAGAASRLEPVVAFEARVLDALAPAVTVTAAFRADAIADEQPRAAPRAGSTTPRHPAGPLADTSSTNGRQAGVSPAPGATLSLDSQQDVPAPLSSRRLLVPLDAPPSVAQGTSVDGAPAGSATSPWTASAQAGRAIGEATQKGGLAVGAGARRAGTSVAGFFARAGRAVGSSF